MKCPYCLSTNNRVTDSRLSREGIAIRRRRACDACGRRFTTYERVEELLPRVVKKDGRREAYDRKKVIGGLQKACEKRPVPMETIEGVANRIEQEIQEMGEKEVPTSSIGERVMRELHALDPVAYVRFASVYREFKDLGEFMSELQGLLKAKGKKGG